MNSFEEKAQKYWDRRYQVEGQIWGQTVSRTAWIAIQLFGSAGVNRVLVPGSGYGRHTVLLATSGFDVTGIEISSEAIKLASEYDTRSRFFKGSALDMSFDEDQYDAVFCFSLLHLFLADDRVKLVRECVQKVGPGGLAFFTAFSEKEADFGKGQEIENNTFESRAGRPAHYFTEDDLKSHFADFKTLEMGLMQDPEDHGGKPHTHVLRYICVRV